MKIAVFCPGRLQSQRLPNKLILPIGSTSLWEIAMKKLSKLPKKYITIALCSEPALIKIAQDHGIKVIKRDPATDQAEGPLKFIFKDLEKVKCTHMMFLNPCLLFLTEKTIIKSLEKFEKEKMDYATSVKPLQNWLFDRKGMSFIPINYERLTTKEIEPIFQCAHCFHIFNKEKFFDDGLMLTSGHGLIEIPCDETIDVDTKMEYDFARWLYANRV